MGSAAIALFASGSLLAGPGYGKPGTGNSPSALDDKNIVGIAVAGGFTTLVAAATCDYFNGDIAALLTGEDKLTVFAPNNAAFLAAGGLTALNVCGTFDTMRCELFNILAYHVIDARRFSNSVFNKNNPKMIEMLNGQYVTSNNDFTLHTVTGQDPVDLGTNINVNATNGVVHEVEAVLIPNPWGEAPCDYDEPE